MDQQKYQKFEREYFARGGLDESQPMDSMFIYVHDVPSSHTVKDVGPLNSFEFYMLRSWRTVDS